MEVAVLLYPGFTALDAIGPYEVLCRMPGATLSFVARDAGPVTSDTGLLTIVAERAIAAVPAPDVIVVPGGPLPIHAAEDPATRAWLRNAHETATWTASVCTGALALAAAGILVDRPATTHWASRERLAAAGARPVAERVVFDGDVVTSAGVSAGIDMALSLAARIAGPEVAQAIQLGIEYDPRPPFDAGSPERAPADIVELVRARGA